MKKTQTSSKPAPKAVSPEARRGLKVETGVVAGGWLRKTGDKIKGIY